jgi:hypothetical protein
VAETKTRKAKPSRKRQEDAEAFVAPEDDITPEEVEAALEVQHQAMVQARVRVRRADKDAARIVRREEAEQAWRPPSDRATVGLLSDQMAMPRTSPRYLVDGLLGWNHNVILGAQYKTGKTTLGLNLARALVDGHEFMGRRVALPKGSRVAWLNGEMDSWDFNDYALPLAFRNPDRVAALHLRGGRLPFLDNEAACDWLVKWLVDNETAVWVVDSWRRLCVWNGISENDNEEVERLTAKLDQVKNDAGVRALVVLAHTGRAKQEQGEERVRGATALDDWADARWVMGREGPVRWFYAEGRGVGFEETALTWDPTRNLVGLGEGDRNSAVSDDVMVALLLAVAENPGSVTTALAKEVGLARKDGRGNERLHPALRRSEANGDIHHRHQKGGRGVEWYPGEAESVSLCPESCPFPVGGALKVSGRHDA